MTPTHSTAGSDLVKVASAADEAEAELIQGFLQTEGVRSVLRRTPGFDVPEFLAAGPRDVLVSEDQAEVAREVLQEQEAPSTPSAPGGGTSASRRVIAAALIVLALVAAAVCVALDVSI